MCCIVYCVTRDCRWKWANCYNLVQSILSVRSVPFCTWSLTNKLNKLNYCFQLYSTIYLSQWYENTELAYDNEFFFFFFKRQHSNTQTHDTATITSIFDQFRMWLMRYGRLVNHTWILWQDHFYALTDVGFYHHLINEGQYFLYIHVFYKVTNLFPSLIVNDWVS